MRVLSDDDVGAMNIWAEARGESFDGQIAVGNVVRNRMELGYSSDGTVVGTVFRPYQFSWTRDQQLIPTLSIDDGLWTWKQAKRAWSRSKLHAVVPADTVLYHAEHVSPGWAERAEEVARIGRHIFYTDPTWRS